jgi:hypothetical protein
VNFLGGTIHPYRPWMGTLATKPMCLICGRGKRAIRHVLFGTDPDAWLGWTADPAETTSFCAWLRIGRTWRIYAWPWHVTAHKDFGE